MLIRSHSTICGSIVLALFAGIVVASPPLSQQPDEQVTEWVMDALRHDARVRADLIKVSVQDGIVTLGGKVKAIAEKKSAVVEAKKIAGVRGVIDEIVVTPSQRFDFDIAQDVRRRILNNASIKAHDIRVSCNQGVVSLSGEVGTHAEELEAELIASEVTGVRAVNNHLLTRYNGTMTDDQLQRQTQAALSRDVYLSNLPISVNVEDRVVTLKGMVGSEFEKSRASFDVFKMSSVKAVHNELQVEPLWNDGARKSEPWPSEEDLKDAVRAELSLDGRIDSSDITAEVEYGHVTLRGSVSTNRERSIAEQDARDVVGVGWVSNELAVNAPDRETARVFEDVRFELASDAMLSSLKISPNVSNGVVTLKGRVHTAYQKQHASAVASRVSGVKKVISEITINHEKKSSDEELAMTVSQRLKQNSVTRRYADEIQVTVNGGVARLTGLVTSWATRIAAGQVAFNTDGIWDVDNELTVIGFDYRWKEKSDTPFYLPYQYDPIFDFSRYNFGEPTKRRQP